MKKITTLEKAAQYSKNQQKAGNTVGLIVGSFDILHLGHIRLFRLAKKYSHKLIVGIDNDKTITLTKGAKRPINNLKRRLEVLSELESIDKVFCIPELARHGPEESPQIYKEILLKIKPTHVFTHQTCDIYTIMKDKIAKELKIKCIIDKSKEVTHSGTILKIIESEL